VAYLSYASFTGRPVDHWTGNGLTRNSSQDTIQGLSRPLCYI
jgi:hypothetical protein